MRHRQERSLSSPRRTRLAALAVGMSVLLAAPSAALAGPWTPEPGHGYLKLWIKALFGFGYIDAGGAMRGYGDYGELALSGYGEVGLVDGLALTLHFPLYQGFLLEDPRTGGFGDHHTVGDPTLSLRWRFLREDRFVMALEAGVRSPFAPSGPRQVMYSTDAGNPVLGALQIGSGAFDVPVGLSAGYGWDDFYLAGAVGWMFRLSTPGVRDLDQALFWSAEGGGTFDGGFSLRVRLQGLHAIPTGDPLGRIDTPSGVGSGVSIGGFAVEGDVPFLIEAGTPRAWIGGTIEGGIPGLLYRQTGGPVLTLYVASRF